MLKFFVYLFLGICCISCYGPKIHYENVDVLIYSIKQTELYIKKIPTISYGTTNYVTFMFSENGHFDFVGSTYNYNPNDTTWVGRNNLQKEVDTCSVFPGLNMAEWHNLKKHLLVLKGAKIWCSSVAYYNDGVFRFFYYPCIVQGYFKFDPFCLAVFNEDVTLTEDFNDRFWILDKKKDLYLLHLK